MAENCSRKHIPREAGCVFGVERVLEQQEILDKKITVERINLNEATIDQYDVEGCLSFARQFISDLSRLWLEVENKPAFQKLVFPEGIPYQKDLGFGTARLGQIFELNRLFGIRKNQLVRMGISSRTPFREKYSLILVYKRLDKRFRRIAINTRTAKNLAVAAMNKG